MTDEIEIEDGAPDASARTPMATWKKAIAALSLVLGIVGVASGGASSSSPGSASTPAGGAGNVGVVAVADGAGAGGADMASGLAAGNPKSLSAESSPSITPDGFTAGGTGSGTGSTGGTIILGDGSSPEPEPEAAPLWAPLLAKGGLSFFVAFCIGYALRTFIKGTMLVFGVVALAIFGLQKAGIVGAIDWEVAQGYWDDLTAGIGRQFESLKTFVTGSLPSAASAGVGLVAGFRR